MNYFGDILAYEGKPVETFFYSKELLLDNDYPLKVVVTTTNGYKDYVTKRIICRWHHE